MTDAPATGLLLDTNIWVWYLAKARRLRPSLRAAIDAARASLWLSPMSIWELGVLCRRGRVELTSPFADWVRAALERVPVQEAPVTREVAIATESLALEHHDPADRVLAATALAYELTLVTSDRKLIAASWLPTVS